MRTNTQEAVLSAYIASIGKRTPRRGQGAASVPPASCPRRLKWQRRWGSNTTPELHSPVD
jgi:hypothetical protein